ncbi:MAG: PAS-domain containing protein [Proteobacteria bacterium]|nr:PAS-domain containing protein [Pseudomonadota bacterium]
MSGLALAGILFGADPMALATMALALFVLGWALREHGRAGDIARGAELRASRAVSDLERRLIAANRDATEILDHVDSPVAVFDSGHRLEAFNAAFARLSRLPPSWLSSAPRFEDLFDRLRAERLLPERRDFTAWRAAHLALFEQGQAPLDETWHLPAGISVRVRAWPRRLGGVVYVAEDVSERVRSAAETKTQEIYRRATLDTIPDGLAVFGADGRLAMYNTAFAALWPVGENELEGAPHLAQVAAICGERLAGDTIWSRLLERIGTGDIPPDGYACQMVRSDGRVLWITLTRLPLGATLIGFEDRTEIERFEEALGLDAVLEGAARPAARR